MTHQTIENLVDRYLDNPEQMRQELTPELASGLVERSKALSFANASHALELAISAETVATTLNHAPTIADSQIAKGLALSQLRRFPEALDAYQTAHKIYTDLGLTLKQLDAKSRSLFLVYALGESERALREADETLAACNAQGATADRTRARVLFTLGVIHKQSGDLERALAVYENAHALHLQLGETTEAVRIEINRANIFQEMDRFDRAQIIYQQALEQLGGASQQSELIGHVESNLGLLSHRQGEYEQAVRWFESAETRFEHNPVMAAMSSLRRAIGYQQLGLLDETIALGERAERVFTAHDVKHDRALALQTVGTAQMRLGAFAQASDALTTARGLYDGLQAEQDVADTEVALARLALAQADLRQVKQLATGVLARIDPKTQPRLTAKCHILLARAEYDSAQNLDKAHELASTYKLDAELAQVYVQQATLRSALEPDAAWPLLKQALTVVERQRAQISVDEFRLGFVDEQLPVYEAAVAHLVAHDADLALLAVVLDALHQSKAAGVLDGEISAELRTLRQQWHWFNSKLEQQYDADTLRQLQSVESDIAVANRSHLLKQKRIDEADALRFDTDNAAAWMDQIQRALPQCATLLQLFIVNARCHALIITETDLHRIDLCDIDPVGRLLLGWRHHLGDVGLIAAHPEKATQLAQRYLQALHRLLIEPLNDKLLVNCQQLNIILPAEWHDLPVAALYDGQRYLAETLAIRYLSSLSTAQRTASPIHSVKKALLIGNSCNGLLPNSVAETRSIRTILNDEWTVIPLSEDAATWQAVRPHMANASLIHCATHAMFRLDNPLFSWLQLADHRMTVRELYEQPLRARPLVVLSACETGRGKARGGGIAGMARGWLMAGASGLMATSWRVEDNATANFMATFYKSFNEGHAPDAALQLAQSTLIEHHPFYWAGFVFLAG